MKIKADDMGESIYKLVNWDKITASAFKELAYQGVIKSFKELKKFDRIEIGKTHNEMIGILCKYAKDENYSNFYMHIPFINEGVVKCYEAYYGSLYIYFKVKNVDIENRKMLISMDIYRFYESSYTKVYSFDVVIWQIEPTDDSCSVHYSGIRYGIEEIELNEKARQMIHSTDTDMYYYVMDQHNHKMKQIRDGIIEGDDHVIRSVSRFIDCMIAINVSIEERKMLANDTSAADYKSICANNTDKSSSTDLTIISAQKKCKRNEVVINGIKITKGENSNIKITKGIPINRRADVWNVVGHIRRYKKSGKIVYVKPHKKGPARLTKDPEPKTYKVVDKKGE